MAPSRSRSPSPASQSVKRLKTTHTYSPATIDPAPYFTSGILEDANAARLHDAYKKSEPYNHAILGKLFQDDLLNNVQQECLRELSFSLKETDIFKIHQTGDLASLSYLTEDQLALFPGLLTVRDALYSPAFRKFIQSVTGCGPLSGTNQDMSVNTYRRGCHLLNHDDVIGSRRVSYIVYMPTPHAEGWQREWGGALELYSTRVGKDDVPEPEGIPSVIIPPSWNQFVFFEVRPGKSFHAVEEVVVGGEGDERQRLSISGWFHAAQEGEDGYEPIATTGQSSREQLVTAFTKFTSYPQNEITATASLSKEHISFLSEWLNPTYLNGKTLASLLSTFVDESSLELCAFLRDPLAERLETALRERDLRDGLAHTREGRIPQHTAGLNDKWVLQGPPIKRRYTTLSASWDGVGSDSPLVSTSLEEILWGLQEKLLPSEAFRMWLGVVTTLLPLGYTVEARRFRPGLDYTLATSDPSDARLDVVLGLTPSADVLIGGDGGDKLNEWDAGDWGGWEAYIAPPSEDDDPAVYRSGQSKTYSTGHGAIGDGNEGEPDGDEGDGGDDMEEDGMEDDNETLLTAMPSFNRLLLVLRDQHVMRFVKYVSAAAASSRWDVCAEYEVGKVEEDTEENTEV